MIKNDLNSLVFEGVVLANPVAVTFLLESEKKGTEPVTVQVCPGNEEVRHAIISRICAGTRVRIIGYLGSCDNDLTIVFADHIEIAPKSVEAGTSA